jgi:hypothetical protein
VAPHFRFKKDLIFYLNSSRAASSGEFKFKELEAISKIGFWFKVKAEPRFNPQAYSSIPRS